MKKSIKLILIAIFTMLMCVCLLTGCGSDNNSTTLPLVCQHRDADDNSLCDKCGEEYADGIDVLHSHDWSEWRVTTPATCQANGVETRTCACGESETRPIAKKAHTYGSWRVTTPATCQTKGVETRTCACGKSETRTTAIDSTAHTFNKQVVSDVYLKAPATTTTSAQYYYSCACGAKGTGSFVYGDVLTIPAESVTLNKTQCTLIVGSDVTLVATVNPANATDKRVTWTSSNTSVATVSNGIVTAISEGTATITVKTANGRTATCTVTVEASIVNVTSITLNKTEVTVTLGNSVNLVATVSPNNATDKTVTWQSSDETVAKVINGAVTTLKPGTATITATTSNGKTAECVVTVEGNAVIKFELTQDYSFYVVTGIEGRTDRLEIPFLYDGLRVIGIKENAFNGNTDLREVILPNSIQYIYAGAFKNCSNLETINLPESLTFIGESAFENCTSLEEITIPGLVESISTKAFYNCTDLKSLTIKSGVKEIGLSAFSYCSALESVIAEEGLETIGIMAFDRCTSLISFEMPNTVTTLGNMAFRYAESLRSVKFSTNLTAIGNACFQSCISLDNVELHAGIVSLGESCFSWCSGMKNLRILGDVTYIGNSAFYECTGLENVYYASSLSGDMGINNYIFYNAGINGNGIVFTLSKNASIPDRLFEPQGDLNRPKLVKIIVEDGATSVDYFENYNKLPHLADIELPDTIVYIKKGCFDNTAWWDNQEEGAVYIGNIFYGYKGTLTGELEISNNTVSVAFGALEGQKPTTLKIPFVGAIADGSDNTHFGYIFGAELSTNQSEYIPDELTYVAVENCNVSDNAFDGCFFEANFDNSRHHIWNSENTCTVCQYYKDKGVIFTYDESSSSYSITDYTGNAEEVIIPSVYKGKPVTSIGEYAFRHCKSLTSIVIPDSVTSIGSYAFFDCGSLTSVTIGNGVTSIGSSAFSACNILVEVYNLSSLNVSSYFSDEKIIHTSLEEASILETVGDYIFMTWEGKYYLIKYTGTDTEIVLPEKYKGNDYAIYNYAFYYCISLTSITIPNSVTSIGDWAFCCCKSLTSITIPDSVTSIGNEAFKYCDSLTSVTIGNGVTSIGYSAFAYSPSLTSITYRGTTSQWEAISRGDYWKDGVPAQSVICSDGSVSI